MQVDVDVDVRASATYDVIGRPPSLAGATHEMVALSVVVATVLMRGADGTEGTVNVAVAADD